MVASLRVAILTPYSFSDYAGGNEVFNEQLARCLPGVHIFSLPRRKTHAGLVAGLDSLGFEHPRRAWAVSRAFFAEHRRDPFRLVICNGMYGWPLSVLPPGIPAIQVYHYTMAGLAEKGIAERGVRFEMRHLTGPFDRVSGSGKHVIAVGRNVLEEVRRFYHHDGRVIPNGVDVRMFSRRDRRACREALQLPQDARIGLFVGRAEYAKGFDILQEVVKATPGVRYLLVGSSVAIGANTTAVPRVSRSEMPTYYSASDFLILPSRYEGFNLTILEALACDLPILVSRAAYSLDNDGRDVGAVVETQDSRAYVEQMQNLPTPIEGSSLRERIVARYSLERFVANWQALASELTGTDGTGES